MSEQRIIKFRCFLPAPYGLGKLGIGLMIYDPYIGRERAEKIFNKYWMQFTGLKDKNGKEIYEGDILEIDDDGDRYKTHVRDEDGVLAVDHEGDNYTYIAPNWLPDHCELEVIGNIYESPELLRRVEDVPKSS